MLPIPGLSGAATREKQIPFRGALLVGFWLLMMVMMGAVQGASAAERDWTGDWKVSWSGGGGRLVLEQKGEVVTGHYAPQRGIVEAKVKGALLEGRWTEGARSGEIQLLMNGRDHTFAGRSEEMGWWTGQRRDSIAGGSLIVHRNTPAEALASFMLAANRARAGEQEAWDTAAQAVEFAAGSAPLSSAQSVQALREYFDLIDLTTFEWWTVPPPPDGNTVAFELEQLRSGKTLMVNMRRDAQGQWSLVVPGHTERDALKASLVEVYRDDPPSERSFLRRRTPRDAMRTFLEGMSDWQGNGRALALGAMDLRGIPDFLQQTDGVLLAEYLRRALQQIGMTGLQSIPNDPRSRDPYVHYVHPLSSIIIAPSGPDPNAPWQFTLSTVSKAPELYFAVSDLPEPAAVPPGSIPPNRYFVLRDAVKRQTPALLYRVGRMELWQLLLVLVALPGSLLVARWLAGKIVRLFRPLPGMGTRQPKIFVWALTFVLALAALRNLSQIILGISGESRRLIVPAFGTLMLLSLGIVAWNLLTMLSASLTRRVQKTQSRFDDILVNLMVTGGRIIIVLAVSLGIANLLSIPSAQILAGLGIGGLAFAIAARDTLSNFFGAGIIVTDRPFRTGDWINAGTVQGTVEEVGIRSTRIRTADDSVAVIPNGKLSDLALLNLGARRRRVISLEIVITDGATPERLQVFMDGVRACLAAEVVFAASETTLGITSIGKDGIVLALRTWVNVGDDAAELAARHKLLIDLMGLARENNMKIGKGMEESTV